MKHDLTPFTAIITTSSDEIVQQRKTAISLRMDITFINGSILHVRENVVRETQWVDYAYQWQTANHQLIIRWDNAHEVNVPSSPHHQHTGSEENIQPSEPMTLETVLTFIANRLITSD